MSEASLRSPRSFSRRAAPRGISRGGGAEASKLVACYRGEPLVRRVARGGAGVSRAARRRRDRPRAHGCRSGARGLAARLRVQSGFRQRAGVIAQDRRRGAAGGGAGRRGAARRHARRRSRNDRSDRSRPSRRIRTRPQRSPYTRAGAAIPCCSAGNCSPLWRGSRATRARAGSLALSAPANSSKSKCPTPA